MIAPLRSVPPTDLRHLWRAAVSLLSPVPTREYAAAEEGAKLLLDEVRGGLLSACGAREETFELFAEDSMKESLLGFMAFVLGHTAPNRDRRGGGAPRAG